MNFGTDHDYDGDSLRHLRGPTRQQAARFSCGCLTLVGLTALVLALIKPYTEYLWFVHDARHPQVFTLAYATKGQLFAYAFILAVAVFHWNLSRAVKVSLVFVRIPAYLGEAIVSNALSWVKESSPVIIKWTSLILGFIIASGFAGEWNTFLLAKNAQSFGKTDPTFGLDIGFFVFKLPWHLAVANTLLGLAITVSAITIGVYVGMQALAALAKIELSQPQIKTHVSLLIGCTGLFFAVQMWLRRYGVVFTRNSQFTGAGYADMQQLMTQTVASGVLAAGSLATLVNAFIGKPFRAPLVGGIAFAAWSSLGVLIYPALVQRFKVEPDRIVVELPYAKKAIEMTRYGYGLDRIITKDVDVQELPTEQEIAEAQSTLDNMRLWDPDVLRQSLDVIQTLKGYYIFNDVDVDRYRIDGKQTLTMIAARDINHEGLDPRSRSWITERLQYTHGYGVTASPVNSANSEGKPNFFIKDIPLKTHPDLEVKEPRIYFSDYRLPNGELDDPYAIVHSNVLEFDYPFQERMMTSKWKGDRGIPFGGTLTRLFFSIVFQDINPLISGNITHKTRLLMHRSVIDRASLIYPFLQIDRDPYITVINGRLLWILDGYTISGQMPYSARMPEVSIPINYVRNSVKITVDAYSGETKAYAVEPDEPILRAYRAIYPGLVLDFKEMPKGVVEHLRYPEDMFMLQAYQLQQYHVEDPTLFLNNSNAWELPYERGISGNRENMRPYYVQMRLPNDTTDEFLLILPFTPRAKVNMNGWLAAHCDPTNYGKLVLYRYPEGMNIPGPAQMESVFNQNETIANLNRQLNNDQSKIIPGNLLVVPIGNSVIYVKPLFLQSRLPGMPVSPELKKVILATKNGPVVGENYADALDKLFGASSRLSKAATGSKAKPEQTVKPAGVPIEEIRKAHDLYKQAKEALRKGDFSSYGELIDRLGTKLEELGADR